MTSAKWKVKFLIHRQKETGMIHLDEFDLEVNPDEYILDGIERIWAFHDRSLSFRHACHHSACGICGMRVNGVEKLTCITPFREVTKDGGTIKVEPLRNFPVVSDLVADMSSFYTLMEKSRYPQITQVSKAPLGSGIKPAGNAVGVELMRLNDCIECGLCISACPVAMTTSTYYGPAVLAGMQFSCLDDGCDLIQAADSADGVWRCHSAYECSEVCPSFVEPGWRIMELRKQVVIHRIKQLFNPRKDGRR